MFQGLKGHLRRQPLAVSLIIAMVLLAVAAAPGVSLIGITQTSAAAAPQATPSPSPTASPTPSPSPNLEHCQISLSRASFTVSEGVGQLVVGVNRICDDVRESKVDFFTQSGSATAGLDFVSANGRVQFANSETSKTITLFIIDDSIGEPDETFSLILFDAGGSATLVAPSSAIINIQDNDGGAPSPSPTPTASPSPTPNASPSPTPNATPFEIEADLTGAPINGITPKGDAEFEVELNGNREFRVRVENVNLPSGTVLDVLVDGVKVGTITLIGVFERSELLLKSERGQAIPQINTRTRVVVATQSGMTIVAGSFSNIPPINPNPTPTPSPSPSPSPSPTPNAEFRIEAKLAGAPINGLTPVGVAKFKSEGDERELEVEIEKVNLAPGAVVGVFVNGLKVGDLIVTSTLENELELETERGQFVPNIIAGSTVAVVNSQGQTILGGVFNTLRTISSANDVDDTTYFVEQQYRDFFGREADDSGLSFWSNEISTCGGETSCMRRMRVNTSGAFFLSIEFQETGYMLYRFNKASFEAMPRRNHFLIDMQSLTQGLVVGAPGWQQQLEDNKRRIADDWVARPAFIQRFGSLSDDAYVRALFSNAGMLASAAEIDDLVAGLRVGHETRATVLRRIADHPEFKRREQNPAFVLMQYFGYLHRNPDEGPDTSMQGFLFWLSKLNEANGDFHRAEMVRAFIESIEYRDRFEW